MFLKVRQLCHHHNSIYCGLMAGPDVFEETARNSIEERDLMMQ
jgi:hypothetical protein